MTNDKEIKNFLMKKYYNDLFSNRKLISATIEIINTCNFKCIHCYNQGLKHECLNYDFFIDIIDQLMEMGLQNVTLTGGEPTLHKDFAKIYNYCYDKGLKITLFSNGFYLNNFLELFKTKKPDKIEISIYGANNNTYYNITGVERAFDKVINNIKVLKDNKINVHAKSVIMQQNYTDYEGILKIVNQLNIQYRTDLSILKSKNFSNNQKFTKLTNKQYYQMMDKLKNKKSEEWINSETRNFINKSDMLYTCGAGRISLFVGSNGGVRLCNFAEFSELNAKEYSIINIWKSFEKYLNKKKDLNSKCGRCKYKNTCTNCPVTTYMEYKNNGMEILPVKQNCREAKYVYKSVINDRKNQHKENLL